MSDSGVDAGDTIDQEKQWDIIDYQSFFEGVASSPENIVVETHLECFDQSDSGYGSTIDPLLTVKFNSSSPDESVGPVFSDDNVSKHLNDRLVHLFFKHVHPLCPVMDEAAFYMRYRQPELSGVTPLNHVTMVELHATKFAASLVSILSLISVHSLTSVEYTVPYRSGNLQFKV
jgi:hypothetical protein